MTATSTLIDAVQAAASKPAVQALPSAVMVGDGLFDIGLPRIVTVLGAIFIVLQIAYLVWKWRREAKHQP